MFKLEHQISCRGLVSNDERIALFGGRRSRCSGQRDELLWPSTGSVVPVSVMHVESRYGFVLRSSIETRRRRLGCRASQCVTIKPAHSGSFTASGVEPGRLPEGEAERLR